MYSLPYHTQIWILGPLTNQRHIKYQLFARDIKLLHSIKCEISNSIVREFQYNYWLQTSFLYRKF